MSLRRVLIVSEPGKDGVFDFARDLIFHLYRHHPEVAVDLAFSSKRGSPPLEKLVEQVRARGDRAVDLRVGRAPQPGDLRALWEILRLVRENRPQVIHAISSKAGGLCRVLSLLWPGFPPVIYMPHAYYGLGGKKSPAALVFNTVERLLGHVGMTINCSADERRFALETLHLPPRRLVLINNGIDVERYRPVGPEQKLVFRKQFGLPENVPLIVSVGRHSYQKNYEPLYAALEILLTDPDQHWFFAHAGAGSEELRQQLSPSAQQRCACFNHISDIERLLQAGDAFILTSRYEGLSLAVLDAVACGLKLFLTRAPGNRCLQRLGFDEVIWIEPTEDASELAWRIEQQLRAWLTRPVPASGEQVTRARRCFDRQIQFEKVYRLYHHTAIHPCTRNRADRRS